MKQSYRWTGPTIAALLVMGVSMTGCSLITSTTDAVSDSFQATTKTTSSTSHSADVADNNARTIQFVRSDLDAIQVEAAQGHGEELNTLAVLLNQPNQKAFGRWMQRHYSELFSGLKKPDDLLARIRRYQGNATVATLAD